MSTHDLVIRGATLVDGTGSAACVADVAIDGDRITAVHRRGAARLDGIETVGPQSVQATSGESPGRGRREIDAQGRFLIPEPLRRFAGLERKVTLVGQGNKFEIWDEDAWTRARVQWIDEEQTDDEMLPPELDSLSL